MTRLNVYAGPAGFYIVRGGPAGDGAVKDTRTGMTAVLPGPAPKENDRFPSNKTYFEIPIAIQDRSFNADGSLFYPDSRAFFDDDTGPYIPESDISPYWNPEFFGNAIMVNGATWPFQTVQKRRYRFRFLNGCQARFLILDFNAIPGVKVWQIGNEGGFLQAPVDLTASNKNRLLMGLAERADMIVDFTDVPVGDYVLRNVGPDSPFGGGDPDEPSFPLADPATTGQIMQFKVVPAVAADPTTPPQFLRLPAIAPLPASVRTRPLALLEMMSMTDPIGGTTRAGGGHARGRGQEWRRDAQDVGRRRDREPHGRRHRGLGVLQLHRRRSPDARARGRVRGGQPPEAGRIAEGGGHQPAAVRRRPPGRARHGRAASRTR